MLSKVSQNLKTTETSRLVTVAAGCFWGVEKVFTKHLGNKGLVDVRVGYANGIPSITDVTYEKICTGKTEFSEAIQVSYEPNVVSLKEVLDFFFRMHDPTTKNAQGPDVGTQYRSAIFLHDESEESIAQQAKEDAQKTWYPNHNIVTIIEPLSVWYDAEEYHQKYLTKNPTGYECPSHFFRTKPKI